MAAAGQALPYEAAKQPILWRRHHIPHSRTASLHRSRGIKSEKIATGSVRWLIPPSHPHEPRSTPRPAAAP